MFGRQYDNIILCLSWAFCWGCGRPDRTNDRRSTVYILYGNENVRMVLFKL